MQINKCSKTYFHLVEKALYEVLIGAYNGFPSADTVQVTYRSGHVLADGRQCLIDYIQSFHIPTVLHKTRSNKTKTVGNFLNAMYKSCSKHTHQFQI